MRHTRCNCPYLESVWQFGQSPLRFGLPRTAITTLTNTSAVPSRNSANEAAIQLLSAVLGSVAVAAPAALALDGAGAAVLTTVVLVVVVVLGVAVAGLRTGSVADPAPGRPTAGPAPPAGSPAPPGSSRPSVSPAGAVAPWG